MRWSPQRQALPLAAIVAILGLGSPAIAEPAPGGEQEQSAEQPALVVIDPGHGGSNSGAPSVREGILEKHLTLALAFDLRRQLQKRGLRVVLTRETDEYLTLRQRVRQANALNADLFVSLHGNASTKHSQRGYETYILTPRALDVDGRALRIGDGALRIGVDSELAQLLDDVERGTALPKAAQLAAAIQDRLAKARGKKHNRGVRQDSMHVLLGATMPAVLVEVGFVDHPVEGQELLDASVRREIVAALADAISASAR